MKELRETMKEKQEQRLIELRRAKVMELLSKGYTSQTQIADIVKWSEATVSRDITWLKQHAAKELETHMQERLPFEYARAMTGINATLTRVSEMLDEAKDPKTKIECMKLQMDLWKSVMSMATDGGIIQRAVAVIKGMESKSQPANTSGSEEPVSEDDADIIESEEDIPNEQEEDLKEEE
jgi:hypothetical protein